MAKRIERVLFRAAAGPRRGFGHLARCGVVARVLGTRRDLSLRGSAVTIRAAKALGWRVIAHTGTPAVLLRRLSPVMLIVDDPSTRAAIGWVRAAQRLGIPVASMHDLGSGRAGADLTIDGSLRLPVGRQRADLQGPAFAVLHLGIEALRARAARREPNRVLVALGGGAHIRTLGPALAARIRRALPHARVDLAAGLLPHPAPGRLPAGCRWITMRDGLAPALANASAAVLAGGITLYEACALGTPVVTLAVVPAQRVTTRAFAMAGATIDASGPVRRIALDRAAAGVSYLLSHPREAAKLAGRARQLVDGRGASRVREHLLALVDPSRAAEHRHVA